MLARPLIVHGVFALGSVLCGCDGTMSTGDASAATDASSPRADAGVAADTGPTADAVASDAPTLTSMGCTPGVVMPTEENTGPAPGTTFTDLDFSALAADTTYTGVRLRVSSDRTWPSNVTLVDSIVSGAAGGVVCFHLERVRWEGGIYVNNRPGITCDGTIRDSTIINPYGQAMRPACTDASGNQNTSGMPCTSGWTIEDSYLSSPVPGMPGQHLEAMQGLWDTGGFTFRNVNFFVAGPPNDTQTGDINWNGSDTTFADCWFTGGAGYRVYAAGNRLSFSCPRFTTEPGGFGPWYPEHFPRDHPGLSVTCPVWLDGTPLPESAIPGSTCP